MDEIKSKRYAGLIKRAVKLHEEVESKGWMLAAVVFEAIEELRQEGYILVEQHGSGRSRLTACRRVARDMGVSERTAYRYYTTWRKYADPESRDSQLTFHDHAHGVASNPERRAAVIARRLRGAARSDPSPLVDPANQFRRFVLAKSSLRKIIESDIWDYSDREKALAHAAEVHQLAMEALVKLGGQKDAEPGRRRAKVAA